MSEFMHNHACVIIGDVYAGDSDEGLKIMQPLRGLGTPLLDMSQPMPYAMAQSGSDASFPRNTCKSHYLAELTDDTIDVLAGLRWTSPEGTALPERPAPFMVSTDGMWERA